MVDELTKIIAKNTSDIQDLQVGEGLDYGLKYIDLTESIIGSDILTAKKRVVGTEFNLGRSSLRGSGAASSYDRLRGTSFDLPKLTYDAGLMALYNLDEATAVVPLDSSVNANNAVAISGTSVANGKDNFLKAREFNGTSDMINLGNAASMNIGGGSNFTVEFWAKPADLTNRNILSKGAVGARTMDISTHAGGAQKLAFYLVTNAGVVNSTIAGSNLSGIWTHFACSYDASYMRIYINGSITGSSAQTGSVNITGSSWTVGNFYDGFAGVWWKGAIDDLAIYNYAKTDFSKNSYQPSGGTGWTTVTL